MMAKKSYSGINIQWPISELILSGKKTIETRTYPIPKNYLNNEVVLIETPGKSGKFKSRARAIVIFTDCFCYKNKTQFYADVDKHCVDKFSPWAWKENAKWGWRLEVVRVFVNPKQIKNRIGIRYTKSLTLP